MSSGFNIVDSPNAKNGVAPVVDWDALCKVLIDLPLDKSVKLDVPGGLTESAFGRNARQCLYSRDMRPLKIIARAGSGAIYVSRRQTTA